MKTSSRPRSSPTPAPTHRSASLAISLVVLFTAPFAARGSTIMPPAKAQPAPVTQSPGDDKDQRIQEIAGLNPVLVNKFLEDLKKNIAEGNKAEVSQRVAYPLRLHLGSQQRLIRTPAEFIKSYDKIITAKVKAAILEQTFEGLFVNQNGLMIGAGELWFSALPDEDGKFSLYRIIAINN